jgi:hypothetical protein
MKRDKTIKERLVVIETLMTNHLAHHDMWVKWIMWVGGSLAVTLISETTYILVKLVTTHGLV